MEMPGQLDGIETGHDFLVHCYATELRVHDLAAIRPSQHNLYRSEFEEAYSIAEEFGVSLECIVDAVHVAKFEIDRHQHHG